MRKRKQPSPGSINIRRHDVKDPPLPKIEVDIELSPHLREHPLLKLCNRSFFMILMGRPGAGKSSHIYAMLTDKNMLASVFEQGCVFVMAPPSSIASFGDSRWSEIDPSQFYEECTEETLSHVERRIDRNRDEGKKSLLLLDDVQKDLKGDGRLRLLHLIANRRHKLLWIMLAAQTYRSIPYPVRQLASDLFCFNVSKETMETIYKELIEMDKSTFDNFFKYYKHRYLERMEKGERKPFIYINIAGPTFFVGWDEELRHKEDENAHVNR